MNNDRILTNKERNVFYHEGELDNQGLLHAQDAKTIIYRDKEWAKTIDNLFELTPDCWLQDGCGGRCTCEYYKWQNIKNSMPLFIS